MFCTRVWAKASSPATRQPRHRGKQGLARLAGPSGLGQRIGQDVFRDALLDYWGGRCPLTGITELALLKASHIVSWADSSDEQRLDVRNGLLLSALWDAAFDKGLVSFSDDGAALERPALSETARRVLGIGTAPRLEGLRDAHRANLKLHRARHGF